LGKLYGIAPTTINEWIRKYNRKDLMNTRIKVETKDEPDNRLLELADISKADFIITGNTNDFTMEIYNKTRIVTP
jgi:predicted nucleic acid-binding protein